MRIGIVNASSRFGRDRAEAIEAWFARNAPEGVCAVIHRDSFAEHGHFGGPDAVRAAAVLETANDPDVDAVWFARGGYGACRIVDEVAAGLTPAALRKRYLGYSDTGTLLAALHKAGARHVAHGPMASDILRGDAPAWRAVNWLAHGDPASLEPSLAQDPRPAFAFNLTILSALMGTAYEPDLAGGVVMVEEVCEALYRVDRLMFHLTSQPGFRRAAGLRLGRVSEITPNDPEFHLSAEEIARHWCARAGVPFLGFADIGHDAENKVVPFGRR